jgi:thiol:disulfide interchange protein
MKHFLALLIVIVPVTLFAQGTEGIRFRHFQNWQQILNEAKAQNKIIFVDAYTTWCVPCKKMDEVYKDNKVGDFANDKFIAVKIQFDETGSDDQNTKNWYKYAKELLKQYDIEAFPTFHFV